MSQASPRRTVLEIAMWTLRVRGPKGKTCIVQVDPKDSMAQFLELAGQTLSIPAKKTLTVRSGFPPKQVEYTAQDDVESHLANNDTVVITLQDVSATQASSTAPMKKGGKATKSKTERPKEPKRGVHSVNGKANTTVNGRAFSRKRKEIGEGVRLGETTSQGEEEQDGSEVTQDAAPKYTRMKKVNLTSKDDIGEQLAAAVSGQSNDRGAKFFRAATKSAVEHQYAITRATARLNAALSRNFTTEECDGMRRASGDGRPQMKVTWKEGVRKWADETVDLLQERELRAAIKYILVANGETGREMLKPFNMAQLSTRVFWSIARLYDGQIADGLRKLVPEEDWSYLDIRTRVESKKAQEAKASEETWRQYRQKGYYEPTTGESSGRDDSRQVKAAPKKVKIDPDAVAKAAIARMDQSAKSVEGTAVSDQAPLEIARVRQDIGDDEEETTTVYCDLCNKARILSLPEATEAKVGHDKWSCSMLKDVGREASCRAVDDEVVQITGVEIGELLRKAGITTRKQLADTTASKAIKSLVSLSDGSLQEKLEAMIDEARLDEVNDAMVELVGDYDVVNALEVQKLGTPADLVTTPADYIFRAVESFRSFADVKSWQSKAGRVLEQHPWMHAWRTV